jgi:hypothetical protein
MTVMKLMVPSLQAFADYLTNRELRKEIKYRGQSYDATAERTDFVMSHFSHVVSCQAKQQLPKHRKKK